MRFTTLALPFALAGYCSAWTKDANGVWVANNKAYNIDGISVHEACTTMNTRNYRTSGWCEYWADSKGRKIQSECRWWGAGSVAVVCYPR